MKSTEKATADDQTEAAVTAIESTGIGEIGATESTEAEKVTTQETQSTTTTTAEVSVENSGTEKND